ncbi:MAG TPA: CTP synthase, partial [Paludibacter sp.]|nr:CTP synthase [Paludibacter sp.]
DLEKTPKADMEKWTAFVEKLENAKEEVRIAIVGKYVQLPDAYKSIIESLIHASAYNNRKLKLELILSDKLTDENIEKKLQKVDGIVVAPGFGQRGMDGKFEALKYARENNIPCLGICMGMQTMSIEFARNVLGYVDANSTEIDANTTHNIVDIMDEQKNILDLGGSMRLGAFKCKLKKGSKAYDIYKKENISERHRHRYEFNNAYKEEFEKAGMICSGMNVESDLIEIIELKSHKWYIGVQFHPEYSSTVVNPHPLFISFVKAAIEK